MSVSTSRWQRVLGIVVTLIMVFAMVTPTAVNATKAPVREPAKTIQGRTYEARFVGQTNGTLSQIAERLYGPTRGITETLTGKGAGPFKEQTGSWNLPWAKSKRNSVPTFPKPSNDGANTENRKRIYDEEPSPDLFAFWEGLNQGSNRTLFGFGFLPPDTTGDTSGDVYSYGYYVQTVNTTMAVWDYSQTNVYGGWPKTVLGPMPMNELWAGTGTSCEVTNDGDPIVRYDEIADRWIITQFALPLFNDLYPAPFSYPFAECIAVSQTGDPTGDYYLYEFVAPTTGIDDDYIQSTPQVAGAKMPDYPKFGVWEDGYYMSVNQFDEFNTDWAGAGFYVFDRQEMLLGNPAGMIYFDPFSDLDCSLENLYSTETQPGCFLGGMLPADNDGSNWANWGGGEEGIFMQFNDDAWATPAFPMTDSLEVWRLDTDNWLGSPTLYQDFIMPVDAFDSDLCGYARNCIDQPVTTVGLAAISDRLMDRLQYRLIDRSWHYGPIYEVMVTNHTVDVNGADRAGVRWYELRRDFTGSWGPWYVYQQGTYSPDSDSRWMGSMAADAVGNLALGYSVSGASTYPTIRYTTHAVGDPLGTMRDEVSITSAASAAGAQTSTSYRWGDYSSMTVASGSGCDFVYTTEYLRGTTPAEWYTRMGNFGFMTCFYDDVEGPILEWLSYPGDPSPSRYAYFDWDVWYEYNYLDYYECSLDYEAWWACSPYQEFYGLTTGTHTFMVRGVDDLGNVGEPIVYIWEVIAQTATAVSAAGADGYVMESNETSDVGGSGTAAGTYIYVGDQTADRQVMGIMSFNVSLPLGAVVTDARIEYRMDSFAGTNPFSTHGPLMLDIATPFFGAASTLAAADFQAAASSTDIGACSSVPVSSWYTCTIDSGVWGSLSGTVQFRFHFSLDDNDDGAADMLRILSGNYLNAAYRPVLVIDYYVP